MSWPAGEAPALSCILSPHPDVVEHARAAESLGYQAVWVNDSPALYPDVWVVLDRVARSTARIGVGPAVIVPGLRHVVTVAAAARTLATAYPGRLRIAVGRGFTARFTLSLRPNTWPDTAEFVRQLAGLLAGERVTAGSTASLGLGGFHREPLPEPIPILLAADGAAGRRHAAAVADGLICDGVFGRPTTEVGLAHRVVAVHGTVLHDAEPVDSDRVRSAAGPAVAMRVRYLWLLHSAGAVAARVSGGPAWLEAVRAIPASRRRLEVLNSHFNHESTMDEHVINAENIRRFTITGTADEVREHVARIATAGATEIAYRPAGPDVVRELATFAQSLARQPAGGGVRR